MRWNRVVDRYGDRDAEFVGLLSGEISNAPRLSVPDEVRRLVEQAIEKDRVLGEHASVLVVAGMDAGLLQTLKR